MNDKNKAVASVATGGVTSASIGGMGLAIGGTAVSIGMLPMIGAGAVVGLAVFGTFKAFGK